MRLGEHDYDVDTLMWAIGDAPTHTLKLHLRAALTWVDSLQRELEELYRGQTSEGIKHASQ